MHSHIQKEKGLTYSQNSMTGDVAFSEVTFRELLVFWNSTQFSTHEPQGRKKEKVRQSTLGMAKENRSKTRCLEGPGLESCEPHISRAAALPQPTSPLTHSLCGFPTLCVQSIIEVWSNSAQEEALCAGCRGAGGYQVLAMWPWVWDNLTPKHPSPDH